MKHELITVSLCENELKALCGRYHFRDTDLPLLKEVYQEYFEPCIVSAYFIWNSKSLEEAAVLMTLGKAIDEMQNHLMASGQMSKAYIFECLSMELLTKAYKKADDFLHDKTGLWCGVYMFPGSDGSLEGVAELVDSFRQEEIIYNEAYNLIPKKSVAYKVTMVEEAPATERESMLCASCSRHTCENRKKTELNYGYRRIFGEKRSRH